MVRKTVGTAVSALRAMVKKPPPRVEIIRRLLIIIKCTDEVFVMQGKQVIHVPGRSYAREARDTFQKVFGYSMNGDSSIEEPFTVEEIEWHPIVFHLGYFFKSVKLFENANLETVDISLLTDHPLCRHLEGIV